MVINSIKIKSFIVITFFVVFFLIKPADEYRINKKDTITIDFKSLNRVSESLYAVIKINKKSELIMSKFSTSWKQRSISFKDSDIIKFKKGN